MKIAAKCKYLLMLPIYLTLMASAEEYKKAYGMKEMQLEGKIKNAIEPVFASMGEEIRRALESFREEQGKSADLLLLSGGGANLPGLAEELTKLLGIEVQVIQPFIKMDMSKVVLPIDLNSEGGGRRAGASWPRTFESRRGR